MHYFMNKDSIGFERDRNNMMKSLAEASRTFGGRQNVTCAVFAGHKVYWMHSSHADQAIADLQGEGLEIIWRKTGAEVAREFGKQATEKLHPTMARATHAKFGEGTVVHKGETASLMRFIGQKKDLRVLNSHLTFA